MVLYYNCLILRRAGIGISIDSLILRRAGTGGRGMTEGKGTQPMHQYPSVAHRDESLQGKDGAREGARKGAREAQLRKTSFRF